MQLTWSNQTAIQPSGNQTEPNGYLGGNKTFGGGLASGIALQVALFRGPTHGTAWPRRVLFPSSFPSSLMQGRMFSSNARCRAARIRDGCWRRYATTAAAEISPPRLWSSPTVNEPPENTHEHTHEHTHKRALQKS